MMASSQELLVVRGDGDYSPYEVEVDGKYIGFHLELTKSVAKSLDIKVTFRSYPWKRALAMVESGKADAITYVAINPDRERYIVFTEGNELSWGALGLVVSAERKKEFYFNGQDLDSLKHYEFGHLLGYSYGELYDTAALNKHAFATAEQLFGTLRLRRIDIAMMNRDEFQHKKASDNESVEGVVMLEQVLKMANYIGFSRSRGLNAFSERFAKAMLEYKKTQPFIELQRKYAISY